MMPITPTEAGKFAKAVKKAAAKASATDEL